MTDQTIDTSWRQEYLEMKAGLSKFQIQLLREGPKQLAQAWLLGAMHSDYEKMKGIKPKYDKKAVNCQSSLQEFFKETKDQGV